MDEQNVPAQPQIKITFPEEGRKQELQKAIAIGLYGLYKTIKYFYPDRL